MAKTITWETTNFRIRADGGDVDDPITFQDIVDYFKANPIDSNIAFPQKYGASPYELCEGNASDWNGVNGMNDPIDDAVDFRVNSQSIKAEVASLPSSNPFTLIAWYNEDYVRIDINALALGFSVGDEILVGDTTNFNGIYQVTGFLYSTYMYARHFKNITSDLPPESSGNVYTPLAVEFNRNNQYTDWKYPAYNVFWACMCDAFNFSIKSDGVGSPILKAITIRNGYNYTPTNSQLIYGCSTSIIDLPLTSSWQDIEYVFRDDFIPLGWGINSGVRAYYARVARIYFFFDGLSVGENVWLDGVRMVLRDPNPKELSYNEYEFFTPLYIGAGGVTHFRDHGFLVKFTMLEQTMITNAAGTSITANGSIGDIQLGDWNGTDKEGGTFYFNQFSSEDNGAFIMQNVRCQGIQFQSKKDVYAFANFSTASGSQFRNCNFVNQINFYGAFNVSFENCAFMGGRYFMAFPGAEIVINGMTVYGIGSYPFFIRGVAVMTDFKGLKIIDATANKSLVYADSYGEGPNGVRFVNFDISECNNPQMGVSISGPYNKPLNKFAFSFNLTVTNGDGVVIENANVIMKDKDGNELFNVNTNSSGAITEQIVTYYQNDPDSVVHDSLYFDNESLWVTFYPYTLTITKANYQTYTRTFFDSYTRDLEVAKKGAKWEIALQLPKTVIHSAELYGATIY